MPDMKKAFSLILSVLLVLSVIVCAPAALADEVYIPSATLLGTDYSATDISLSDFAAGFTGNQPTYSMKNSSLYVENYDVDLTITKQRTVKVVETITVIFNQPMHGFQRRIPFSGAEEMYRVTNVKGEGAECKIQNEGSEILVRLGSENKTVTGKVKYVISYDIEYFNDITSNGDRIYQNIIPAKLDNYILDATARIHLPEDAQLLDYRFYTGSYGMRETDELKMYQSENTLYIYSANSFSPGYGATTELLFPDGYFEHIPADVTVSDYKILMDIDKYGRYTYTQTMNVKSLSDNAQIPIWQDVRQYDGGKLSNVRINVSVDGKEVYSRNGSMDYYSVQLDNATSVHQIKAVQTGKFAVSSDPDFNLRGTFSPIGGTAYSYSNPSNFVEYKDAEITINCPPFNGVSGVLTKKFRTQSDSEEYFFDDHGVLNGSLPVGESVDVTFTLKHGVVTRPLSVTDIIMYVLSGGLVALSLIFLAGKKRRSVIPAIEYYPPDGMNPAEVGYIIDNTVDSSDLTSLIYYWASHGHLVIEMTGKNTYTLHKGTLLDAGHKDYEYTMYGKLWSLGDGTNVRSSELEMKYYTTLSSATRLLKAEFDTEEKRLTEKRSETRCKLLSYTAIIATVLVAVISIVLEKSGSESTPATIVLGIFASLIPMMLARSSYDNRMKSKAKSVWMGILAVVIGVIGAFIYSQTFSKFTFGFVPRLLFPIAVLITVLLASKLLTPSEYGASALGKCAGFKQFLQTAEKSRLEMLLEDNPDYYYDILPYAQVLGVSSIWAKKFENLKTEPPAWFYGTGVDYNTARLLTMRNMTKMNNTMRSSPSSSGSGGGFSGGGGSFGGGFSGGGGGGGSGGGW